MYCGYIQLLVLLSGVVAFSVNLSIYWIIGNTSPVTYPFKKNYLIKQSTNNKYQISNINDNKFIMYIALGLFVRKCVKFNPVLE